MCSQWKFSFIKNWLDAKIQYFTSHWRSTTISFGTNETCLSCTFTTLSFQIVFFFIYLFFFFRSLWLGELSNAQVSHGNANDKVRFFDYSKNWGVLLIAHIKWWFEWFWQRKCFNCVTFVSLGDMGQNLFRVWCESIEYRIESLSNRFVLVILVDALLSWLCQDCSNHFLKLAQ